MLYDTRIVLLYKSDIISRMSLSIVNFVTTKWILLDVTVEYISFHYFGVLAKKLFIFESKHFQC